MGSLYVSVDERATDGPDRKLLVLFSMQHSLSRLLLAEMLSVAAQEAVGRGGVGHGK